MVKVAGKGCVLVGGGRRSPPLPYIEVSETEARALIGTGNAVLVGESELVPVEEPVQVEPAPKAPVESQDDEPVDEVSEDDAASPVIDDERSQTIAEALDLLEPEHFVKTGERKGRPKLNAVEDISGIRDLTTAEIDAVFTAKDAE